jgi:hypothetical protein
MLPFALAVHSMNKLLLVKLETAADAASPEAEYSLGSVRAAAERVWPTVELARLPASAPLPRRGDVDTLLVGPGNVLVTSRSLAAMAARRREGASLVLPFALPEILRPEEPPPYTLRGFERFEERFLATPRPSGRSVRLLPLALLAGEVADSLPALSKGGGDDLISALDLDRLALDRFGLDQFGLDRFAPDRLAREGLYHHFADYHGQVPKGHYVVIGL